MSDTGIRPLLAATAAAAVFAYGLSGHGLPQMSNDDGMAAAAGLCLLLAAVLTCTALPKPDGPDATVDADRAPSYAGPPLRPALDGRARASPSTLQRFRN
jgi:hypothetical protein